MKKSELKQLIKEIIKETDDIGGASLNTDVAELKRQLEYFSNVIDVLEDKDDWYRAGQAKKEYWAIEKQLEKLGVKINETTNTFNIDVEKLEGVKVAGVDTHDYPDFADAYIEYAEYDGRPLTDEELDWVNDAHPEFVSEKAHESVQGASGDYKDYFS